MTMPNEARDEIALSQQIGNAYVAILPAITEVVHFAFRRQRADRRQELVSAAIANAFVAYCRLAARGRLDLVYPTVLARFAVQQTCEGRRIGSPQNSKDILSDYAQKRRRFRVFGLNDEIPGPAGWQQLSDYSQRRRDFRIVSLDDKISGTRGWERIVIEDRRASPAEIAAFRIDFADWLSRLRPKLRSLALVLSVGNTPAEAAERFQVTRSRISQLREELRASWQAFQAEALAA